MENFIILNNKMLHKSSDGVLRAGTNVLCIIKAATASR